MSYIDPEQGTVIEGDLPPYTGTAAQTKAADPGATPETEEAAPAPEPPPEPAPQRDLGSVLERARSRADRRR